MKLLTYNYENNRNRTRQRTSLRTLNVITNFNFRTVCHLNAVTHLNQHIQISANIFQSPTNLRGYLSSYKEARLTGGTKMIVSLPTITFFSGNSDYQCSMGLGRTQNYVISLCCPININLCSIKSYIHTVYWLMFKNHVQIMDYVISLKWFTLFFTTVLKCAIINKHVIATFVINCRARCSLNAIHTGKFAEKHLFWLSVAYFSSAHN